MDRELLVMWIESGERTLISIKKRDKDAVVKTRPLCAGDLINRKAAWPAHGQDRVPLSPSALPPALRPPLRARSGDAVISRDPVNAPFTIPHEPRANRVRRRAN